MSDSSAEWSRWNEHVLQEIKDLREHVLAELKYIREDITLIKVETGQLKIRAGLTGLVGGLVPVLILVGVRLFG